VSCIALANRQEVPSSIPEYFKAFFYVRSIRNGRVEKKQNENEENNEMEYIRREKRLKVEEALKFITNFHQDISKT
jgi:hypothetical protein